jgi:MFS family permease
MNAHGVAVERILHRPIMSSLHAGWSFGGLAGAALVASAGGAGLDPRVETLLAAGLLALLLVACLRRLGDGSATAEAPPGFVRPTRAVVVLALLCLIIMVTEGAMADWGGIYLTRDLGTSTAVAALAFAAFSGGMTAGRVFGDWLNHRLGAATLMQGGSALAGLALGGMLLLADPALAIGGFFLVGIGVANGVPLVFSAAGHAPAGESGPNIAAVSSMGSIGFLAGPPFIGFFAEATSLPLALATLCLGLAVVTIAGRRIGAGAVGPGVPAIEAAH